MTTETEILNPKKELTIAGETITVRELSWMDALDFIKQLAGYLGSLVDAAGNFRINIGTIADLVVTTNELALKLIAKTTGKDAAWIEALSLGDMLELIDIALALNLSDEILAKGKKIAGRFQKFASAGAPPRTAPPASPKPMSTSSATGTPAAT